MVHSPIRHIVASPFEAVEPSLAIVPSPGVEAEAEIEAEAEVDPDEEEDEWEEEEGGDPNPLIAIGDKMVAFLDIGDELQAAMVIDFLPHAVKTKLAHFFFLVHERHPRSIQYDSFASFTY